MVWCRKAILHVPIFPSLLGHNSHLRTFYSDGWKRTFLSRTGRCRGFTLIFICNQVTFSIWDGLARCILDLFKVYPPPPWGLASPRLTSPSCPCQSLISHFQDSHQAFLGTEVVLGINPGRTSPCFSYPPLITTASRVYTSVSHPPGRGPVPGSGINYIGPREGLLEFVILVF